MNTAEERYVATTDIFQMKTMLRLSASRRSPRSRIRGEKLRARARASFIIPTTRFPRKPPFLPGRGRRGGGLIAGFFHGGNRFVLSRESSSRICIGSLPSPLIATNDSSPCWFSRNSIRAIPVIIQHDRRDAISNYAQGAARSRVIDISGGEALAARAAASRRTRRTKGIVSMARNYLSMRANPDASPRSPK